jgi:hypothetical protein
MSQYAAKTEVSMEKSEAEIKTTLRKYGASGYMSGWRDNQCLIAFEIRGKSIRFVLNLPHPGDKQFTEFRRKGGYSVQVRSEGVARQLYDQACRQRFRALALCIKAKMEAVECGIVTFEQEFLAHFVMPDGRNLGEHIIPQLENGQMPKLTF